MNTTRRAWLAVGMAVSALSALMVAGGAADGAALAPRGAPANCALSGQDEEGVDAALGRYVDGWLANSADQVMAVLTDDIVLQPHHGGTPVVGSGDVRDWWFPIGPPTVITSFTMTTQNVSGCEDLAYAWGRSAVEWDFEGVHYANEGNALSVLRRSSDGTWRIAHQIWNDPLATTQ